MFEFEAFIFDILIGYMLIGNDSPDMVLEARNLCEMLVKSL